MSDVLRRVIGMMARSRVYATWNPADKGANVTLSNENKTLAVSGDGCVRANIGKTSGKWYFEYYLTGSDFWFVGVGNGSQNVNAYPYSPNCLGAQSNAYWWNNASSYAWGVSFGSGQTIGIAVDLDLGQLNFYVDGSYQGTLSGMPSGTIYPIAGASSLATTGVVANFGASAFTYNPLPAYNQGWF